MYIHCYMQTCISNVHPYLCAIVNKRIAIWMFSLYYKTFPLLMKKLLFNWHTQDNRGLWCVMVKDPVMLYTAIWNQIRLFFIMIKVVSSTHFIFIKQLLRHSIQDWMVFQRYTRCSANSANAGMFQKCFIEVSNFL